MANTVFIDKFGKMRPLVTFEEGDTNSTSGVTDVIVGGETLVTDNIANLDPIQSYIEQVEEDMRYNAIHTIDATLRPAVPNEPREYTWLIKFLQDEYGEPLPIINSANYRRYLYDDPEASELDTLGNPNIAEARKCLVWDGKHIYFEIIENGLVNAIDELTDTDGNPLLAEYRPIPRRENWYFGTSQADSFPVDDNIRSMIDRNVTGLSMQIGDVANLETIQKRLDLAINEVLSQIGIVSAQRELTLQDALDWTNSNPGRFAYVPAE